MKLLKQTLKKSSRLTEKLLRRLDKEWEDVFKEDTGTYTNGRQQVCRIILTCPSYFSDDEARLASVTYSLRKKDGEDPDEVGSASDSDGSVRSLESLEKVLKRKYRGEKYQPRGQTRSGRLVKTPHK